MYRSRTRPQFAKATIGSYAIRNEYHEVLFILSGIMIPICPMFSPMRIGIPKPRYNIGIAGSNHGEMTGQMLVEIEKILLVEKLETLLVYGYTNSTVAGALLAVKLHITVIHVEAGK